MSGVVVTARLTRDSNAVRLAVDTDPEFPSPTYSSSEESSNRAVRLEVTGLTANTDYYCAVEVDGQLLTEKVGRFRTLPSGPSSFKAVFAGDASTGSNATVFDTIRAQNPLFFFHLGDLHYENINTNSLAAYLAAYDAVMASERQAQLYREVPTFYMWDDHDYGPNDSHGSSPGRDAACEAFRLRVPHPALEETGTTDPVYYSFEVGRVMFIVTDQRSMASNKTATDNSSKTMLGTTQKTWFKGLLSDPANDGKLFVWICSRVFGGVPTAGADHWGGFTTERTELCDHIQSECPGRLCVISADMHSLAIDDGSNHDFVTSGSEPIPTFQCAPLDRTSAQFHGGATYSEGQWTNNGQFGVMEITDTGGSSITIDWTGYGSAGNVLGSYQFNATLGTP